MNDQNHYKTLKNEELAKRVNDLRLSLLPVSNLSTLSLLEEIERRLGGGQPLIAIELLPKKEQELRKSYEFDKSFSTNSSFTRRYGSRPIEPYEEWKVNHIKFEQKRKQESKARVSGINNKFQNAVDVYYNKGQQITLPVDRDYKLTENAQRIIKDELSELVRNKKSLQLLMDKLQMNNLKDPSEECMIKFWFITRFDYEKTKSRKLSASKQDKK